MKKVILFLFFLLFCTRVSGDRIRYSSPPTGAAPVANNLIPAITDTYDIGSSSYKWKDLYLAGEAQISSDLTLSGSTSNLYVDGEATVNKLNLTYIGTDYDDITSPNATFGFQSTYVGANPMVGWNFFGPAGRGCSFAAYSDGGTGAASPYTAMGSTSTTAFIKAEGPLFFYTSDVIKNSPDLDDHIVIKTVSNTPEITTSVDCDLKISSSGGNVDIGDGTNYTRIDADGDLRFYGTADYLVPGDDYAFRYTADEDYGLFFASTGSQYEFRDSTGAATAWLDASTVGHAYIKGNLGVGDETADAKLDVEGDAIISQDVTISGSLTVDTDTLFVDSTNNKVGIGTTSPDETLYVVGNIACTRADLNWIELDSSISNAVFVIDAALNYDAVIELLEDSTLKWRFYNDGSDDDTFEFLNADWEEKLTIEQDGDVGIGDTSPDAKLDVEGDCIITSDLTLSGTDAMFYLADGTVTAPSLTFVDDPDTGLYSRANNQLSFATAGTERMWIDGAGNIGLGDRGSNYAWLNANGDLKFAGTADYLVAGNDYAFRYSGDEDTGLYFDLSNTRFTFLSTAGVRNFSVNATATGNTYIRGDLEVVGKDINVGDAGGFSGIKFNSTATTLDFWIDGVKVSHITSTGEYIDATP